MGGHAGAEPASFGKRSGRRTGRGKASGLVDTGVFLRETLRPAARDGGVVVHEDVRAVIYRLAFKDRLDQKEGLPVLVARRVRELVVRAGELPIQKPEEAAPRGALVDRQARRENGRDRAPIGPEFDGDAIAGIVPWRQRRECGLSLRGEGNGEPFEHMETSLLWWSSAAIRLRLAQRSLPARRQ